MTEKAPYKSRANRSEALATNTTRLKEKLAKLAEEMRRLDGLKARMLATPDQQTLPSADCGRDCPARKQRRSPTEAKSCAFHTSGEETSPITDASRHNHFDFQSLYP